MTEMKLENVERSVAIDGPSASGKSTVARLAARALSYVYVDSGAFYRGLTWKALRDGLAASAPPDALAPLLQPERWALGLEDGSVWFSIDGERPGLELRGADVRESVSDVAAVPEVRSFLVRRLRDTTRFGAVVMEGRDIGSVVFPESRFKFYLDASPEERARRRLREIVAMEGRGDVSDVQASLVRRDAKDRNRQTAPLQIALNAKVIDSTGMTAEQVAAQVVACVRGQEGVRDG